jgi:cystathionine beta-lyase/cystathionine gamma-synthase
VSVEGLKYIFNYYKYKMIYIETPNNYDYKKDGIDAMIYMISIRKANTIMDNFIACHINKKPKYMPKFIYKYLLKRLFVLDEFR